MFYQEADPTIKRKEGVPIENRYFPATNGWSNSWVSYEVDPSTTVEVEITMLFGSGQIDAAVPRPAERGFAALIEKKAVITVTGAQQLTVDINGALEKTDTGLSMLFPNRLTQVHSFHIFANPLLSEIERPDPAAADVRTVAPGETPPTEFAESTLYFLPGVHHITERPDCCSTRNLTEACACNEKKKESRGYVAPYMLKTGKSYYIPGDAYVHGHLKGQEMHGTKIFGYGTLSGELYRWTPTDGYNNAPSAIWLRYISDVTIMGLCILDYGNHHLKFLGQSQRGDPTPNTLSHVKVLGWRINGDGLHLWGRWNNITDLFLRTSDDSTYIGDEYTSTVFKRISTINDANGAPFIFGLNPGGPTLVEDCDVLYHRKAWPGFCGGVFDMREWAYKPREGLAVNIEIRNVRITDPFPTCPLFNLRGARSNVSFTNITMDHFSSFTEMPHWLCHLSYNRPKLRFSLPNELGCDLPYGIPNQMSTKFKTVEWYFVSDGSDPSINITNFTFDNVKIGGIDLDRLIAKPRYEGAFVAEGQIFDDFANDVDVAEATGLDEHPPTQPPPAPPSSSTMKLWGTLCTEITKVSGIFPQDSAKYRLATKAQAELVREVLVGQMDELEACVLADGQIGGRGHGGQIEDMDQSGTEDMSAPMPQTVDALGEVVDVRDLVELDLIEEPTGRGVKYDCAFTCKSDQQAPLEQEQRADSSLQRTDTDETNTGLTSIPDESDARMMVDWYVDSFTRGYQDVLQEPVQESESISTT